MYRKDAVFVEFLLFIWVVTIGTSKAFASETTATFANDVVQRFRCNSANLTGNVEDFFFYRLPSSPEVFNIRKAGLGNGNFVDFKWKRGSTRAIYNKTYTEPFYTFTSYGVSPFTALFLLGEKSGPREYEIQVQSFPSKEIVKFETFSGSVSMRNYTLQYGGVQDSVPQEPTFCEVYFFLPLSPNSNRTFAVSTSYHERTCNSQRFQGVTRNRASVQSGGGQAVLGYILLSKPLGETIPQKEINATMLTMMHIILDGDRSEIFQRIRSNISNLTRNVDNFYSYPIPHPPDVYSMAQAIMYDFFNGNRLYYKVGNSSRVRAAYHKIYTGPSYIFATVTMHPMTTMYFLDANSGPESYSIEVDSRLLIRGDGVLQTFKGSVSLQNYTLKYEGVQIYFKQHFSSFCEVYFYLPLTPDSNRMFSVVIPERTRWNLKNKASVQFGKGEAVLGYTLLSKQKGEQIWNEEIEATMLTMLHLILGVDQSAWSTWTTWSANGAGCQDKGTQTRTRNCTSGPCLKTSNTVEVHKRSCSVPAWIAGIFKRVRANSPDISRNVKRFYPYYYRKASPNVTLISRNKDKNYVYFKVGQEPLRRATYNKSYSGQSYFFETFAIHPFTAMFVLDGNSEMKTYSIEVKSELYQPGTGRFRTYQGSVSLRNYTLQFKAAQHYRNRATTFCEVYYLLPLTAASNDKLVFLAKDHRRRYSENKASLQSGGGPAVFGYTLLSKHEGIKITMDEIRDTMMSIMHLILGIDQQVWSHWSHWSNCPDNCPMQRTQIRLRNCIFGPCPQNNSRVERETRPCSIPVWVAGIFERFRSEHGNLTRLVDHFYRYVLPIPKTLGHFLDQPWHRHNRRNFVSFKEGVTRFKTTIFDKEYTGPSYTFTTFATHLFTAMFLLDGNSVPKRYAIEVYSDFATDRSSKVEDFHGSVTWLNYTMKYGGAQTFSTRIFTACKILFFLPLSPNSNREFNVSSTFPRRWSEAVIASVWSGDGASVLGYTLLSKPVGMKCSEDEIKTEMRTTMNIILSGDKTEISERVRSHSCNFTRNIANYYPFPLPTHSEESLIEGGIYSKVKKGNLLYFKIGDEPRQLVVYNKTYRGPSYTFAAFAVHPFTAVFLLNEKSGPHRYLIEVISEFKTYARGLFETFEGSVSLRNYTLKYRGTQMSSIRIPTACEVYFFLPLSPNSNRSLVLWPKERDVPSYDLNRKHGRKTENRAFVRSGGGKAVFGYTLLSKPFGAKVTKEEIDETMFTMMHILVGVDQSVWSLWTAWSASTARCRQTGVQSRTRNCSIGPCLQTSNKVQTQTRPFSGLTCIAGGIFKRVRANSPDISRNVQKFYVYYYRKASPNVTLINHGKDRNDVYFKVGPEPLRRATYNKSYSGQSYFFETFAIHPFTAMFVLDGNSEKKTYSIEVKSELYQPGTGRFRTYQGSVSLRNYTLQFKVAQHYLNRAKAFCEVYYLLPLTAASKHKLVFLAKDHRRRYSENKASVQSGGGPAVFGYTLLSKHEGMKITMVEIRDTMMSMMHLILGIDQQVWSHWSHWSTCPDHCPGQRTQIRLRSCVSGSCPQNNSKVERETRPCSIPVWAAGIVERFRSEHSNLTRLVENFYRYVLPIPKKVSHFIDYSLNRNNRRNFVSVKVGEGRFKITMYDWKFTGPSYTFTTFATHPYTALFLLDGNSVPKRYAIEVYSDFATDGNSKVEDFHGSVTWLNYTMKYGGAQTFSTRIFTACKILFFLPLTPNSNREFNVSSTFPRPWSEEVVASVWSGDGASVLGYTLLSTPVGIKCSEDEIKTTMRTMMHTILGGDKSEILERVRSHSCNLTRDVANYYPFPLPTQSEETLMKEGGLYLKGDNIFIKGNQIYFKIGDEPRQLVVYNKTYRGPSYTFVTFAVHPFTAFFLLNEKSGPQRYLIEVISETYARDLFETFEGSVSLRNYTLKYRGTQMSSIRIPTACEVYFFLPLTPNSNRRLVLWPKERDFPSDHWKRKHGRKTENRAFVRSGGGKAVFGYTLLSKPFGAKVTKKEIDETMFTMMHILVGDDQSVWSLWTAWSASTARCRQTGVQSRTRNCSIGSCRQTSNKIQTQTRPFSGLTCIAGGIFQRFPNVSHNLTRNIPSFNFYKLPTHYEPTKIHHGSGKMYRGGNEVFFKVDNTSRQLAVYNKSYSGASYFFSTFSIHPFTALFVLDFDSNPERRYAIEVDSNLNVPPGVRDFGKGKFETFDGWVYLGNNALQYGGVQVHSASFPTVCEVYFFLPLTQNLKPKFIVSTPYKTYNYFKNKASLQAGGGRAILGYTLLSKNDHTKISKEEIEATMSTMLQFILVGY